MICYLFPHNVLPDIELLAVTGDDLVTMDFFSTSTPELKEIFEATEPESLLSILSSVSVPFGNDRLPQVGVLISK